jgi:hypothetical protein
MGNIKREVGNLIENKELYFTGILKIDLIDLSIEMREISFIP